jgi:WD40 repeat protein
VWDVQTGKQERQLGGQRLPGPAAVVLTPDRGLVALEHYDHQVRIQETARTSKDLVAYFGNDGQLLLSPDGRFAYVGSVNSGFRLFDVATGRELPRLPIKAERDPSNQFAAKVSEGRAVAFSADGKFLATAGDGPEVRVWEVTTGKERIVLTVGKAGDAVGALAFSPDGRALAVGGRDRHVRLFDTANGEQLADFAGHQGAVSALAFSPDGKRLASGSEDTSVLVWDTSLGGEKSAGPPGPLSP